MSASSAQRQDNVLQKNYHVPVQTTDVSMFDDTFAGLKERFAAEMRRVDDEMNKFSTTLNRFYAQMIPTGVALTQSNTPLLTQPSADRQSDRPSSHARSGSQARRPSSLLQRFWPGSATAPAATESAAPVGTITGWQALISSPLVVGEGADKALKLQFDVSQFSPHEINVKIQDDILIVSARHEERSDNTVVFREYNREFLLPRGIDVKSIQSSLSRDGVLTIQAPLPLLPVVDESISSVPEE